MAAPVITIHDAAGVVIPDGTPVALPVATAGTPTAETVISVRNNAAAGPAVDDATNRVLSILGRVAGTSDDPTADGLAFLVSRALEVRVSATSGGADAAITGYRPLGANRRLSLGTIPDGGVVTLGVRCNASIASSLTDVEAYLSIDGLQTTPLPDGTYEALGNFVYDGRPGAGADADFSEIYSITGALIPDSPNDDSVDIWSEIVYALAGVWYTFTPATAKIVFTAVDGDAATLASGEAYYAAITLDGTNTPNVTKGSKDTTPLTDADKPTPPAGEFLVGWVVVPFGLVITTVEDVADLDFFGYRGASGLDVTIGPGRAAVGGRWWYSQTPATITLADDDTSTVYVVPSGGFEAVVSGSSPTDSQSMPLWDVTTSGGAVTVQTDRRQIGPGNPVFTVNRVLRLFGINVDPTAELDVAGDAQILGKVTVQGSVVSGNGNVDIKAYNGSPHWRFQSTFSNGAFIFRDQENGVNSFVIERNGPQNQVYLENSGNTGFNGQTNPAEAVDVTGNIKASGTVEANGVKDHGALASAPSTPAAGDQYFDTSTNKHRGYDGTTWNDFY